MKTTHVALVVALAPILASAADTSLFQTSMSWLSGPGDKQTKMTLEEVDRTARSSIVEVSGISVGSNSSSTFLLNAMCGLAKARKQQYFQAKQILKEPLTFEVSFLAIGPDSASVPADAMAPNVFSVAFCSGSKN